MKRSHRPRIFAIGLLSLLLVPGAASSLLIAAPLAGASPVEECLGEIDTDLDGTPDCVDGCPTDPDKIGPGTCGCGMPEVDTDGDGICDFFDPCPESPDLDGGGYRDDRDCNDAAPVRNLRRDGSSDEDLDGVPGDSDNCPTIYNPDQRDSDGDGAGDLCDVCPAHPEFAHPSFTPLFEFEGDGYGNHNGLAVDASGKIYFSDAFSQTINVYDATGAFLFELAGPFGPGWVGAVSGLAVGPAGRVYSADMGNWDLNVYEDDGTFVFSIGTPEQPNDVAVGSDGRIYYTLPAGPGVYFRDSGGGPGGTIGSAGTGLGQYQKPWGVAVDDSDNVYVTDTTLDAVLVYDSAGEFVRYLTAPFDDAVDVVVDSAGNSYVADWGNERVLVYDDSGMYKTLFSTPAPPGDQFQGLNALALSPEENILVNFRRGDALVRVYSRLLPDETCPSDCVDLDGDGVFDCDGDCGVVPCADCDDSFEGAWSLPGPAGGLTFDAFPPEWSWTAPADPGGLSCTYDLIRSDDPFDFHGAADCIDVDIEGTVAVDSVAPSLDSVYYYLVRPRNPCGEGSLGQDSFGNARPDGRPCP